MYRIYIHSAKALYRAETLMFNRGVKERGGRGGANDRMTKVNDRSRLHIALT